MWVGVKRQGWGVGFVEARVRVQGVKEGRVA